MNAARRFTLTALLSLFAVAGLLALASAAASAAVTHHFLPEPSKRFGEAGLNAVNTMTVDSGKLYVGEGQYPGEGQRSPKVRLFDAATGVLSAQLPSPTQWPRGIAVGHSTGEPELYVMGIKGREGGEFRSEVDVFDSAGALQKVWTGADTPRGSFADDELDHGSVAVDESSSLSWAAGEVYVADYYNHVVDVFKPTAGGGEEYVTRLEGPEPPAALFASPLSVAVDQSNDEVLVVDSEGGNGGGKTVDVFKPASIVGTYEFVGKLHGPPGTLESATGVTVDNGVGAGAGDIFVSEANAGVVEEFNAAGDYLGHLTETPAGPLTSANAVAVDPSTHDVYVGVASRQTETEEEPGSVAVFGPNLVIPDISTEPPSSVTPASATLNGQVNPDGEGPASCEFVWGTSRSFGEVVKCPASVEGPQAVHVALGGLQSDTTYYYRLQATNKNGTNAGEAWQDREFTTPGPGIEDETVTAVAATSATLEATLNPHGAPTSYYFQYGKSAAYEAQAPMAPGSSIGTGAGAVEVGRHVQGLVAGTIYHYRVVAVSELEVEPGVVTAVAFPGPDRTFSTQPVGGSLTLPDGRQWQMVSPPNKHGSLLNGISTELGLAQASAGGDAITYGGWRPTGEDPEGYPLIEQILSTDGPSGWSTLDISTAHRSPAELTAAEGTEYRSFSEDLSLGLTQPRGGLGAYTPLAPDGSPPDTERTEYIRRNLTCQAMPASCYEPLLTSAPGYADVPPGTKFGGSESSRTGVAGAVAVTPDFAHLILGSSIPLTSTNVEGGLYEWSATAAPTERLQLTSVLPNGQATSKGSVSPVRYGLSSNGSRVFWSVREPGTGESDLYLRDVARAETIQIDQVQAGGSGGGLPTATFQAASGDGSKVFFTDGQRLTASAGASLARRDLYECEIVEVAGKLACDLSDPLIAAAWRKKERGGGSVIGASEDGAWLYFTGRWCARRRRHSGRVPRRLERKHVQRLRKARWCNDTGRRGLRRGRKRLDRRLAENDGARLAQWRMAGVHVQRLPDRLRHARRRERRAR